MTREEILAMKPGLELDALVAEHIFGWRRIKGPEFDYDGPCESNDVLVPSNVTDEEAFKWMPAREIIPLTYFVNRRWSKEMSIAQEVEDTFADYFDRQGRYVSCLKEAIGENASMFDFVHATPEQRCKAALLAVLEERQ